MQALSHSVNPFAQMCDPDAVKNALALAAKWTLNTRICHPLDRPSRVRLNREQLAFDAAVDAAIEVAADGGVRDQRG